MAAENESSFGLARFLAQSRMLAVVFAAFGGAVAVVASELKVTLAGQSLIRADLRVERPVESAEVMRLLGERPADVLLTNFEGVVAGRFGGRPARGSGEAYAVSPEVLGCLRAFGFNFLATSSNHAWDLGAEGILSTLAEVAERGFTWAGTGRNSGEAAAPAFRDTPAGRVALVSFGSGRLGGAEAGAAAMRPGVNEVRLTVEKRLVAEDRERVLAAIRLARMHADAVIVYQHDHYWEEDLAQVPAWKQEFARACVDAGASVFVSHGVPRLQGIELYRGGVLFFGLGNFIYQTKHRAESAPRWVTPESWESILADVVLREGRVAEVRLRPIVLNAAPADPARHDQTRGIPRAARAAEAGRILDGLAALSRPFGTNLVRRDDHALIDLPPAPTDTPFSP